MSDNLLAGAAPAEPAAADPAAGTPPAAETPAAAPAADPAPEGEPKPAEEPKAEEPKADEPPKEYEDFKLPEGFEPADPKFAEFKDFAKDLGLSQDKAQKLLDRYAAEIAKPAQQYREMQQQWVEAVKADKDIGGVNLEKSLSVAAKAIDRFGGNELRQALELTGAGNNPAIVKAFVAIGKAISEDTFVNGGKAAAEVPLAHALYPTMRKE